MAGWHETQRVAGASETSNGPLQTLGRQGNFFSRRLAHKQLSPISGSLAV